MRKIVLEKRGIGMIGTNVAVLVHARRLGKGFINFRQAM